MPYSSGVRRFWGASPRTIATNPLHFTTWTWGCRSVMKALIFSWSPSMASVMVFSPTSLTLARKDSTREKMAVRPPDVAVTLMSAKPCSTRSWSVMSSEVMTPCSSPIAWTSRLVCSFSSTNMVKRAYPSVSHEPTLRLEMLCPRSLIRVAMRFKTPGSSLERTTMVLFVLGVLKWSSFRGGLCRKRA